MSSEEANYHVIEKFNNIEIREYDSMILASLEIEGDRSVAINNGFKILIKYISGHNSGHTKINMTIPVIQENIHNFNHWKISFIMPRIYNLKNLPSSEDSRIMLNEIPTKKMITIRFSGFKSNYNIQKNLDILNDFIKNKDYKTFGNIIFAFYNPPWTLPFLNRNEIMIEFND